MDNIALLLPANEVAKSLTDYLSQVNDRVNHTRLITWMKKKSSLAHLENDCKSNTL